MLKHDKTDGPHLCAQYRSFSRRNCIVPYIFIKVVKDNLVFIFSLDAFVTNWIVILRIFQVYHKEKKKSKTFGVYYFNQYPFNSDWMPTFEIIYWYFPIFFILCTRYWDKMYTFFFVFVVLLWIISPLLHSVYMYIHDVTNNVEKVRRGENPDTQW